MTAESEGGQITLLVAKWEELEIQVFVPDLSHDKTFPYLHGTQMDAETPNVLSATCDPHVVSSKVDKIQNHFHLCSMICQMWQFRLIT